MEAKDVVLVKMWLDDLPLVLERARLGVPEGRGIPGEEPYRALVWGERKVGEGREQRG